MADTLSPGMAFGSEGTCPPQATISLSQTSLMTPEPTTPGSYYSVKDEHGEGDESKKPTKKRKSWGQELPTPKTNLPPRKRAKTEDEKEQRRIERVLRNRQAAQSSRERKRQEVEKLEGEKMSIEQQNESLKERLMTVEHEKFLLAQQVAKLAAQMKAIQRGTTNPHELSPPPESDLHQDHYIKQELDDYTLALLTPQNSFGAPSSSFASPSTANYSEISTPATMSLDVDALTASKDMTQHPAAMFCDPIIYGDSSSLSDVDFGNLFATDASSDDLHFFKDGFTTTTFDEENANGFTFDALVDLDACQSNTSNMNKEGSHLENLTSQRGETASNDYPFEDTNSLTQIAARSSAQQPLLGAPNP